MTIRNLLDVDMAIETLNMLLKLDPQGMERVVKQRVHISPGMAELEDIQVLDIKGLPHLGPLGMVNALFGTYRHGVREG